MRYHNIDKGFTSDYIGYAHGAWHINKTNKNGWYCFPANMNTIECIEKINCYKHIKAKRLRDISLELNRINNIKIGA